MKRFLRKLAFALALVFVVTLSCHRVFWTVHAEELAGLQGFEQVAENENLALMAVRDSGEFALLNKKTGFIWYSNPQERDSDKKATGVFKMNLSSQLLYTYVDFEKKQKYVKNSYTGSVRKQQVVVKNIENGFAVTYRFPDEKLSISIQVTLGKDYLNVAIPKGGVVEEGENYVYSVGLLPYFGAGGQEDEGYMFVPDGSGALIHFNNGRNLSEVYTEEIYGRDGTLNLLMQPVNSEKVMLPVFGVKNGTNALVSVVTKGDAAGKIIASTSMKTSSYNHVYCEFALRQEDSYVMGEGSVAVARTVPVYEEGPIQSEGCEIRYYPLEGKNAGYVGMAEKYRQYLMDEKGFNERWDGNNHFYLDLYGAILKNKSIFGIPFNVIEPLTTFREASTLLGKLKDEGVEHIVLRYMNWNTDNIKLRIPDSVNPAAKLGGKSGLSQLVRYTGENGIQFYPNYDFVYFNKSGNGFSRFMDCVKTIAKAPAIQYIFKLSTYLRDKEGEKKYFLTPASVIEAAKRASVSIAKFGMSTIGIENISSNVYSDLPRKFTRDKTVAAWETAMRQMSKSTKSLMGGNPNAYVLPYLDHVVNIPVESSGYDMTDEDVPFYQIVLRGFVPYAVTPVNQDRNPETLFLKAVETGSMIHYSWIYKDTKLLIDTKLNNLVSADYNYWMDTAVEQYKKLDELNRKTAKSKITGHAKIADGVFKTEYENGVRVIVNYNDADVTVEGKVVQARNYIIG